MEAAAGERAAALSGERNKRCWKLNIVAAHAEGLLYFCIGEREQATEVKWGAACGRVASVLGFGGRKGADGGYGSRSG